MNDIVEKIRIERKSAAVLRSKLIRIRGRYPSDVIMIFEGVDDVGVYRQWIRIINDALIYHPLPGDGKDQLITLLDQLRKEQSPLKEKVFFFVDRDFDGLRNLSADNDIYVTPGYSMENALVSKEVVREYLVDELRCSAELEFDCVLDAFGGFCQLLSSALYVINLRLYVARKLKIKELNKLSPLGASLRISLDTVELDADPKSIVCLEKEPNEHETNGYIDEFCSLEPMIQYRGKWVFAAFRKWLDLLHADRKSSKPKMFPSQKTDLGRPAQAIDLSGFAARSRPPEGLASYITGIWSSYCTIAERS